MRIPVETLVDGVMHTLREEVLQEVSSPRTRSRLWAAIDVLNNLRDRVEEKPLFFRIEADSAQEALQQCAAALTAADHAQDAAAVLRTIEAALARSSDERERCNALRDVVVDTLRRLHDIDEGAANAARQALESHLASQAMRDVLVLKPSLLSEVSKG